MVGPAFNSRDVDRLQIFRSGDHRFAAQIVFPTLTAIGEDHALESHAQGLPGRWRSHEGVDVAAVNSRPFNLQDIERLARELYLGIYAFCAHLPLERGGKVGARVHGGDHRILWNDCPGLRL